MDDDESGAEAPSKPSYDIGYGRPPRHRQFKQGQSGNPRGRPKGARKFSTLLAEAMRQKLHVREGSRPMAAQEIFLKNLLAGALKGDPKARDQLIKLLGQAGQLEPEVEATVTKSLAADDTAIITNYLQRRSQAVAEPCDGNQSTGLDSEKEEPNDDRT